MVSELTALDPLQVLSAAAAVFVGGFLRGFVGFGGALVIIPVLALVFTPSLAVVMHAIMEIPGIVQLLPTAVRHCDRNTVLPMILALIVGIPLGVYVLASVDAETMRVAISVVVLVLVGILAVNVRIVSSAGMGTTVFGGAIGGVVQGATGMGGPPIVALLLSRPDGPDTTRGNIVVMMSSLVIAALPTLWFYGLMSPKSLILGGFAAPVYVLATYLGSRYFRTGGDRFYRIVALAILALTAVTTLIFSLT